MKTVKKGDKVLCITLEGFTNRYPCWFFPKLMEVYTVSEVLPDGCVILYEVDNSHVNAIFREFNIPYPFASFYPNQFIKLKPRSIKSIEAAAVKHKTSMN